MSRTTLFLVPLKGPLEPFAEYQNSHRGAPHVWDALCQSRLGWEPFTWAGSKNNEIDKLWALPADLDLPEYERITLATTFDDVMVRHFNLHKVADAFCEFEKAYPGSDFESHLPAQADDLRRMADDPMCFAACWSQTSVTDAWWVTFGSGDEEDSRRYDLELDAGHWFLFEELPA